MNADWLLRADPVGAALAGLVALAVLAAVIWLQRQVGR